MTPIEKVARAICREDCPGTSEQFREGYWARYTDHARAAVEALREPTEEMETAWKEVDAVRYDWGTFHKWWRATIGALLAEKGKDDGRLA